VADEAFCFHDAFSPKLLISPSGLARCLDYGPSGCESHKRAYNRIQIQHFVEQAYKDYNGHQTRLRIDSDCFYSWQLAPFATVSWYSGYSASSGYYGHRSFDRPTGTEPQTGLNTCP
jgi:hypothetical protein